MSTQNLHKIFNPQRIAVVGASDNPAGVGAPVLRNLLTSGFAGEVYPVNPNRAEVQGMPAYPRVSALPHTPDLAILCTPAQTVPGLIRECGEAGVGGVVVLSAGFREAGGMGEALEAQLREEAQRFPGMRLIGPNCLGVIVPPLHLNASFAPGMPPAGRVAFLSQSGALGTAVLDWAQEKEVGFSAFVSLGNMVETGFGDLIDYFGQDPNTHSIILYVESLTQARQFMSAARAFSRTKPIVAYKAGRFAESARAAVSHTGAMVGEDAVYSAAFQRAGIERVYEFEELFDCAELLARRRLPRGRRLGILTNAGGPGIMATDALMACHGSLAQLSAGSLRDLDALLPAAWPRANPVDILGDAPAERFGAATRVMLADPGVDALLVLLSPQAMTDPAAAAQAVAGAVCGSTKPVLAAWLGGHSVREGIRVLNHAGIATYTTPEQAVGAFMHLVSYARNQETLYESPRELPTATEAERKCVRELLGSSAAVAGDVLPEALSKAVLEAYGIPVTGAMFAGSEQEAVETAARIGYPVVLKVVSPQITHKTDVGGVVLSVEDEAGVREALRRIATSVRRKQPDARFDGVTVQRMVTREGLELILGARKDPVLGAVIMVGLGGVTAELWQDRALGLPPLNERLARRMLESLRAWPLLQGYRGRPGVDLDRLTETLVRFSYLIANHPEIDEIDVNPLLATRAEVVALDARVIVDRKAFEHPAKPYSHLAIRPVPDEWHRLVRLLDGTEVTLRPIRPEDEHRWQEMLAACSPETLHARFQATIGSPTHQFACRYCFIDYDREMALVAELETAGERRLIGVGRVVAAADRRTAELALLVVDRWQGKGLGEQLTDACLEIAAEWGITGITAETAPANSRMLAILQCRGFELTAPPNDCWVLATKNLPATSVPPTVEPIL